MAFNMSSFVPENLVKPMTWLGKHDWINFEKQDNRFIISPDKSLYKNLSPQERKKHPEDYWKKIHELLFAPFMNDKEQILTYALSRALAFGPKLFRPSSLQCQGFENTTVGVPFKQYAQPYETLLIEFPKDYRQLKTRQGMKQCPRFVICWWDQALRIILVACQFDSHEDRIIGVLVLESDDSTIEDLFTNSYFYEADGTIATEVDDFQVAQLFERIAINLNMLMMYGGSQTVISPMNRELWQHYRELKKRYKKQRNKEGLANLRDFGVGEIDEVKLQQEIGFKVQMNEAMPPTPTDDTHPSPHPHWRRGHWCNQPCGPGSVMRKPVLRPPVYVMGEAYKNVNIDLKETSVTYTQKGETYQP